MIKYVIVAAISFGITFLYLKSQNGSISADIAARTAVASAVGSVFAVVVAGIYEAQKSSMITGVAPSAA